MASTFFERIDHLAEQVGFGELVGKCEVDQIYAEYQERRDDLRHPRGGQAYYLRDSLYVGVDGHMERLAAKAITPEGSDLKGGMKDVAEALSDGVHERAPVEYYHLKRSGHPSVTDNGAVVFDRPPEVARLSEEEIRALRGRGES